MGVLGHGRPPPPPGETTCKTQNPATSALRAAESACRPQALKLHPRPEVRRGNPEGPGRPAPPRPRMRRAARRGVGAAGAERAQYRLVHGAALRRPARRGGVPGRPPRRPPPGRSPASAAAARRRARAPVCGSRGCLGDEQGSARARRPPPAPRAPARPRVPAPAATCRAARWRRAPEAGCLFSPVLRLSVRAQQNGISSTSQVHLCRICFNAGC